MSQPSNMQSFVYYFCYGSNLLIQRMHINNKSAEKCANGMLVGFKLTFSGTSELWKGATANIIPDPNNVVYGVIYKLDKVDISNLNKQEFGYDSIEVQIKMYESDNEETITCLTYVQKPTYANVDQKIPSRLYKEIIIKGALVNSLPKHYIENVIKAFPDNGILDCGPTGMDYDFMKTIH